MSLSQLNRIIVLFNRCSTQIHSISTTRAYNSLSKWRIGRIRRPESSVCLASTDAATPKEEERQQSSNPDGTNNQEQEEQAKLQVKENVDWQMATEIEKYEMGKRWLAAMMGEDVETFTDEKIAEAIQYLLPSHLFAKDARPIMKHPLEIFGKRKAKQIGEYGRPLHAGFYTGQASYHDLIYNIWEKLADLDKLPPPKPEPEITADSSLYEKPLLVRWVKQHEMEDTLSCKLSESQYDLLIRRLTRLAKHQNGESAQDFLSNYQINIISGEKKLDVVPIDEDGVVTCLGYRKEAVAEVKLKEGSGKFLVNTKPMRKYFLEIRHRQQITSPLLVTDQLGKYDVDAGVIGGGMAGQAGAIRYALSRALLSFSEAYHKPLDEAGLLTRDSRVKERKKPGRMKARRKFAWVKR